MAHSVRLDARYQANVICELLGYRLELVERSGKFSLALPDGLETPPLPEADFVLASQFVLAGIRAQKHADGLCRQPGCEQPRSSRSKDCDECKRPQKRLHDVQEETRLARMRDYEDLNKKAKLAADRAAAEVEFCGTLGSVELWIKFANQAFQRWSKDSLDYCETHSNRRVGGVIFTPPKQDAVHMSAAQKQAWCEAYREVLRTSSGGLIPDESLETLAIRMA